MAKFFDRLKGGLEDVIAHKKGKITLKSETIEIPDPPKNYTSHGIKKIRKKCNYSQAVFAKVLNVSIKTIQAWESGERSPNRAALRLLEIVDKGIYTPEIYKRTA